MQDFFFVKRRYQLTSITLPTAFGPSIARFFSCKVLYICAYTCKSSIALACQSREFSRAKHVGARIHAKRIVREQSVYVPVQLVAAAVFSRGKIRSGKNSLWNSAQIRETHDFQSIRRQTFRWSRYRKLTSDECRIDFAM